ncbi:DNA polymerase I [Patescibacteria group bacterium]|nr:DNA polymerase I [Patescibacteria group bacterium]MBU1922313.1 DNA polymerase I [Patescibacteria group bacterium]
MTSKNKKTLIILDGNALLHRAWHALPPLTDPKGRVVNAVYGFTTILFKMLKELEPQYVAITFDKPGPTFRHKEYEQYKATRVKQPDELYEQIPMVKEFLKVFKIPVFEQAGYEADDVIGTISRALDGRPDVRTIIVTGDMDALQLVDQDTEVLAFVKGLSQTILYDERAVRERYGFGPKKLIDFKAIKGDPSDNVPGVPGIGDKGAQELIKEYGGLDEIYNQIKKHPEKFKKGVLEKLKQGEKSAKLSQRLVSIVTDLPTGFNLDKCAVKEWDRDQVVKLFAQYGFKSLLNRLPPQAGGPPMARHDSEQKHRVLKDWEKIQEFLKVLQKQKQFALCVETEDANLFGDTLLGMGFYFGSEAYFIEIKNLKKIQAVALWKELTPPLQDPEIKKIGHDLKSVGRSLAERGVKLAGLDFDTMIASYILASGARNHDLASVVLQELGQELGSPGDKHYFAKKVARVWALKGVLEKKMEQDGLSRLFQDIEMPLVSVLGRMEADGIKVDVAFLKKMSQRVDADLKKITKKIYKAAGQEFNVNSPQQLKEILFEKLKISSAGIRRGKTGLSTAASELWKMRDQHPIIDYVFQHRELAKLKSTYVDALPELVDKKTHRLHTSFNQTVTATGRLSSSNPNLQNIPIRSPLGREIRKAFIAEPGNVLIAADYSQIELRIVAALAGDQRMIGAFERGQDIHTATAMAIWGVSQDQVDKDMRRAAKAINFGVIYGQGPHGLAQSADISFGEAKEFIDKYFEVYEDVREYMERTKALAHKFGYVETLFGRRRYLPELNSGLREVRAAAERMAINMPVQGTAADIMKMAMIKIHEALPRASKDAKMILQVHDELVFEAPRTQVKKLGQFIKQEMENVYKLKVPIVVSVEQGKNWGEMEAKNQEIKKSIEQ